MWMCQIDYLQTCKYVNLVFGNDWPAYLAQLYKTVNIYSKFSYNISCMLATYTCWNTETLKCFKQPLAGEVTVVFKLQ